MNHEMHEMIAESVQRLFGDLVTPTALGAFAGCGSYEELWQACVDAGLDRATAHEAHGGIGAKFTETATLLHAVGYAGLGLLALRAFHGGFERPRPLPTLYAGLTVILWGISDEFHQSFVPGRDASGWDVLADAVGFGLAVLLLTTATRSAIPAKHPR